MKNLLLSIITCAGLTSGPLALAQKYHALIWNSGSGLTDLGTLGGDTSAASGINDSGAVVGWSYLADNTTVHVFTWTASGGLVDVGAFPGGNWAVGQAINSAGEISGAAIDANGSQVAFFWSSGGGFVSLGEGRGDQRNYGFSLNDSGTVTGQYYTDEVVHAFVWRSFFRHPVFLGNLAGGEHSVGYDVNNLNHITGNANVPFDHFDAFVWSKAGGMRDIGAIRPGTVTLARAINDNDEVVGFGGGATNTAFYWSEATGMGTMHNLGGLNGYAIDINLGGMITGFCNIASGATHATLWSNHSSTPQDLGTLPGGANSYGSGINAAGQIAGYSEVP